MEDAEPLCYFRDCFLPEPDQPPFEEVYSVEQLEALLSALVGQPPRVVFVSPRRGPKLDIGIGGELAAVYAWNRDGLPPGETEVSFALANRPHADQAQDFTNGGEPQEFEAEWLMPAGEVIALVCEAIESGKLPESHRWTG